MGTRGVRLDPQKLLFLYKSKGWSQQDLARKSGLDVRTITKVKNGGPCDASTHARLATALQCQPEDLLPATIAADGQLLPPPAFSPHGNGNGAASNGGPSHGTALAENGSAQAVGPAAPSGPSFIIEQSWKIVDLRRPQELPGHRPDAPALLGAVVCDHARVRKLDPGRPEVVFPYLTWGDRIECESKPDEAVWERVVVRPGDLVHSEKQWELKLTAPAGPPGTVFEFGPSRLRFVDAFHREGQQWWQVRVGYVTHSLVVQILFPADRPCRSVSGSRATLGQRRFEDLPENPPLRMPDGTVVAWHIPHPLVGAFYKLEWDW